MGPPAFRRQNRADDLGSFIGPIEERPAGGAERIPGHVGQLGGRKGVDQATNSRPEDSSAAHRAGLRRGIESRALNLFSGQFPLGQIFPRGADQIHFGMLGWIAAGANRVFRCQKNFTADRQEGAERVIAMLARQTCELDGLSDQCFVLRQGFLLRHGGSLTKRCRSTAML